METNTFYLLIFRLLKIWTIVFVIVSCSKYDMDSDLTYRKASYDIPEIINPQETISLTRMTLSNLVFDGLFTVNSDLTISSRIAKEWSTASGGKILKFKIHKGILFHNGDELTAQDIFSNFQEVLRKKKFPEFTNRVERVEVISRYELKITLKWKTPFCKHFGNYSIKDL